MSGLEKDKFTQAVEDAISKDRLVVCGITSNTQATFESEGVPYGAGKSTLGQLLSYKFNHYDAESGRYWDVGLDVNKMENWDVVRKQMYYYPSRLLRGIKEARMSHRRINAAMWDDVQLTAGAQAGLPTAILDLVGTLTTVRPDIALLIMTMPNVKGIASVLRELIQFELIVYRRGYYEVQHVKYRKNFGNPRKDFVNLDFVSGEDPALRDEPDFYALPQGQYVWYADWRESQSSLKWDRTIASLERYEKVVQPTIQQTATQSKGWQSK